MFGIFNKNKKKPKLSDSANKQAISKKEQATRDGEPYVEILSFDLLTADDPSQGAFELDWNDTFVARLVKAGYQGKTDQDIVNNWFNTVCKHIVAETWEQEQADPEKRSSNRRDLGDGRTEIS